MTARIIIIWSISIVVFYISLVESKICFNHCTENDPKLILKMDIDGCRRRRSVTIPQGNRGLMNFNCDGDNAPPCTVKRGDTIYFDVEFAPDFPLKNLTHSVHWVSSWGVHIPFPGLDSDACKYLEHNCRKDNVIENQIFSYPIKVLTAYPVGSYNIKSSFLATNKEGVETDVGCIFFVLRIL